MDKRKLWQNVSDNIQFFTYKTKFKIPNESGLYAWYLPFHIWDGDIFKAVNFYQAAMLYDSGVGGANTQFQSPGQAKREAEFQFNWDRINVSLEKLPSSRRTDFSDWNTLKADKESYKSIEEALMKATILSRPLYVGRAKDIKDRYNQHVNGKTGFYERFSAFIHDFNHNIKTESDKMITLKVPDLLFAALPIGNVLERFDKPTTELIESVLMNILQPPFSKN